MRVEDKLNNTMENFNKYKKNLLSVSRKKISSISKSKEDKKNLIEL